MDDGLPATTASQSPVPWAGFHHIAVVTPDLDATMAFYRDVLGMHVGDVRRPASAFEPCAYLNQR